MDWLCCFGLAGFWFWGSGLCLFCGVVFLFLGLVLVITFVLFGLVGYFVGFGVVVGFALGVVLFCIGLFL